MKWLPRFWVSFKTKAYVASDFFRARWECVIEKRYKILESYSELSKINIWLNRTLESSALKSKAIEIVKNWGGFVV